MSDHGFRLSTLVAAAVLVIIVIYVRWCGSLALAPKPAPPTGPSGTQRDLLAKSTGAPTVYKSFIDGDAQAAGVRAPSLDELARKLAYRVDEARHVLEPGQPPIEVAGVRIHLERTSDQVIMVIANLLDTDLAYEVTSAPSTGIAGCNAAEPQPFNAIVIAKGASERRTECVWRDGMAIIVTKVETIEVSPLSSWYLSQLPPPLTGIEPRIARGHRGVRASEPCSPVLPQVVRTGLDRGEIGWRDLIDFYARHRCKTYPFPSSYRAFKTDGERGLPVVDG